MRENPQTAVAILRQAKCTADHAFEKRQLATKTGNWLAFPHNAANTHVIQR